MKINYTYEANKDFTISNRTFLKGFQRTAIGPEYSVSESVNFGYNWDIVKVESLSGRIEYRVGDLFGQLPTDSIVAMPHVTNNLGGWGAGFVVPLAKYFPGAKQIYLESYEKGELELGKTQTFSASKGDNEVLVFNMCAQKGYKTPKCLKPLQYLHLANCLAQVNEMIDHTGMDDVEVHAPAFGSDLSGGDWHVISALIEEILISPKSIYIYTLTREQQTALFT